MNMLSLIKRYDIPPRQGYAYDTGLDVPSAVDKNLAPRSITPVPTGIYLDIPVFPFAEIIGSVFGYVPVIDVQVRSRSGLAKQGILVANSPATIDTGYKGELVILLHNTLQYPYLVTRGEYIAQMVISVALSPYISTKVRNTNGFGSSK